jgi:hypothetical protein
MSMTYVIDRVPLSGLVESIYIFCLAGPPLSGPRPPSAPSPAPPVSGILSIPGT